MDSLYVSDSRNGKKKIVTKLRVCRTVISQAIGLMFSRQLVDEGLIMIFEKPRLVELHMLFVFFSIDVIYADEKGMIVELHKNAKPFISYVRPKHLAKYVFELPLGTISRMKLKNGQKLKFSI